MGPAVYEGTSYRPDASLRSRATSVGLSVAIVLLILLVLIRLGAIPVPQMPKGGTLTSIAIAPEPGRDASRSREQAKPHQSAHDGGGSRAAAAPVPPRPVETPPPPPVVTPAPTWNVMPLSSAEMASVDSTMRTRRSGGRDGSAAGQGSGDDRGTGQQGGSAGGGGGGGDRLYDADWYRRPSDAELAGYMPARMPAGAWGEIACRTIPDYRVEDCRELGETPGSGLSRALRQAAWQFRVLPPRIGGRPVIGAWVRIHFDITERGGG